MRIVDCTIVNQTFELDLFHLKVVIESPCVDEWVLSECRFDYRGRDKKFAWRAAVTADPRFDPYRDRITFNEVSQNLSGIDPDSIGGAIDPPECAEAEWALRDSPAGYICAKYQDGDRVFSSDIDEIIDFEDPVRRDRLMTLLKGDEPLQIDRVRYHYDFNVRAYREPLDMITPCFRVGHIRSGAAALRSKKWVGTPVPVGDNPLVFEYCCVFPERNHLYKKFQSSLHTQWQNKLIDDAIDGCWWPRTAYQGLPDRNCRWHFFEKKVLTERNSPKYVRENLDKLKTNLVPDNYHENRVRMLGHTGYFAENQGEL